MTTRRRWMLGLAVAALLRSLLLGTVTPPYQSSDEHWHIDYARSLSEGKFPELGRTFIAPEIIQHALQSAQERHLTLYGITGAVVSNEEASQPPLAYVGPAIGYRIAGGPEGGMFAFRAWNALMGALTVVLVFASAAQVFPGRRWAGPLAGITAIFSPPAAQVASTINNGATLGLFVVAAIALSASLARGAGNRKSWYALGGLIGLASLCKSTGLLLLGPAFLAAAIAPLAPDTRRLRRALAVLGPALVINAPWAIRNQILYGNPVENRRYSPGPLSVLRGEFWRELGKGTVGVLRWTDLFLPRTVYIGAGLAGAIGAVCAVRWLRSEATGPDRRAAAVVVSALAILVAGTITYSLRVDYQPQGRYLVPGVVTSAWIVGASIGRRGFVIAAAVMVTLFAFAIGVSIATFGGPL